MSFRRRYRWSRRILVGLAFAVLAVPAQARTFESDSVKGEAAKTANSAAQATVISYVSQGLTAADSLPVVPPDAVERAVQASLPVVPPDAIERAVQAKLAAETPQVVNYLSQGLTTADALDPRSGIPLSAGIPVPGDPFIAGVEPASYTIEPGRSWYLVTDPAGARPDDRGDRFAVGDVRPVVPATDGDGFSFDWANGLTVGIGALAFALAIGLALMYMRRPRIAV